MADPTISLYLDGEVSFQLGRSGSAGTMPSLKIQMHDTTYAATLTITGYRSATNTFSLPLALQGSLFDLVDTATNTKVSVPSNDEKPAELLVKAGARNQWFDLKLDAREDFWTQLLTPGHGYEIRWRDHGITPWACRGGANQGPTKLLSVRRLPCPIKLSVFDDTTAPPQFAVSLAPTAQVCHLSGEPRFGFKLLIMSHTEYVVTIWLYKTPLKELHGLEEIAHAVDDEGDEVEWPYGIGCFDNGERFPSDNMFEEFKPGVPYERTFWLEKFDKGTSNGGELGVLAADSSYTVGIGKALLGAFSRWRKGNKEELLAGETSEKELMWNGGTRQIFLDVSEPFVFETI